MARAPFGLRRAARLAAAGAFGLAGDAHSPAAPPDLPHPLPAVGHDRPRLRGGRFLDKTPLNCLRVGYLDALFDDAHFVFLHRRAADNFNSLVEGRGRGPRFVTHRLPEPLTGIAPLDARPPRAGRWRTENRDAVERVPPLVADVERRLGDG